ncbi:MAG TPA: 3-hydroxybutyryl-CoA dehydrogenase, partial [Phaeodactylibacter sp.]|nr:3-hydroxybutyryl-CoA dehydrogenase [Phaeodactylibacter sp.]
TQNLISNWGKLTVEVKDTPGFIVNRVARPFYGEALRILEEGIADVPTIDWAMTDIGGFRMGPFTLMDYIGNDINYIVTETVFKSFYYDPRYKPAFTQKRLSEAGYLGRKTGKGYYDYSENAQNPTPNKDLKLGKKIVNRIVVMLINEAADALFWKIASRKDIDIAMEKGVNYPKGLLRWADEIGIEKCVKRLDKLYEKYGEDRYRCSPMLRTMAKKKKTFF